MTESEYKKLIEENFFFLSKKNPYDLEIYERKMVAIASVIAMDEVLKEARLEKPYITQLFERFVTE